MDAGRAPGVTYFYALAKTDAAGEGPLSQVVSVAEGEVAGLVDAGGENPPLLPPSEGEMLDDESAEDPGEDSPVILPAENKELVIELPMKLQAVES